MFRQVLVVLFVLVISVQGRSSYGNCTNGQLLARNNTCVNQPNACKNVSECIKCDASSICTLCAKSFVVFHGACLGSTNCPKKYTLDSQGIKCVAIKQSSSYWWVYVLLIIAIIAGGYYYYYQQNSEQRTIDNMLLVKNRKTIPLGNTSFDQISESGLDDDEEGQSYQKFELLEENTHYKTENEGL